MCYSNGKIDSLRRKPNWLISLWLLEIISAGWMARDRDGETHLPPPLWGLERGVCLPPERGLGLYLWSLKLHWATPPPLPPSHCGGFELSQVYRPLLWPGDLPLTFPQHLAGLQLVILESGCAPVGVNETVDAKNSSELRLRRARFTCHCCSDGLFMRWGKFITYKKSPRGPSSW